MSDTGFRLPKSVAAKMIDDFENKDTKNIKSVFNTQMTGNSLRKESQNALRDFADNLSPALKKMKQGYYAACDENCYDPKHISDSFTNMQQINLCK